MRTSTPCTVALADLTDRNANVFYELGLVHNHVKREASRFIPSILSRAAILAASAIAVGQVSDTEPSRRKYRMKNYLGRHYFFAVGTTQVLASPIITVGPNVNITRAAGNQAESTISVNPANPLQLFESDTVSGVGHFAVQMAA